MKALYAALFSTLMFGSLCAATNGQTATITRVYKYFNSYPEKDLINGKAYEIDGKKLFIVEGSPVAFQNENDDWEEVHDILETDIADFKQGAKINLSNDPVKTDEIILSTKNDSIHTKQSATFDQKAIITEIKKDKDNTSLVLSNGRTLTPIEEYKKSMSHDHTSQWKVNGQIKLFKNSKGNYYVCDDASQVCVEMKMSSRWKW